MNEHIRYLKHIEENCLRCHSCSCYHSTSMIGSYCYGELATLLLHENQTDFQKDILALLSKKSCDFEKSIFGCHQCNLCLKNCPKKFNAKEFMFHARAYLESKNNQLCKTYDNIRVDQKENIFAKLKKEKNIHFDEALKKDGCKRLFLPGCHMTTSFPDLTKKVTDFLIKENIIDGMSSICCGNPLYASGLYQAFYDYVEKIDKLYQDCGVISITTPCPSCYDFNLRIQKMGYLKNIEVRCLSKELVDHNIKINRNDFNKTYKIAIHDSCPDRRNGIFASSIRKLYEDFDIQELEHHHSNSLCCGCGGLVPFYSSEIADAGKQLKLVEFNNTHTDCLITTCFNCYKGLNQLLPIHQYLEDLLEGMK